MRYGLATQLIMLCMTDERGKRRNAAPMAIALIVLLVVLPCVYVLSIGPIAYLVNHGHPELAETANNVYYPIFWLCDSCAPIGRIVVAYMELWTSIDS
jgi:hypothetical protein